MDPKNILLAGLLVIALVYFSFWTLTVRRQRAVSRDKTSLAPAPLTLVISFIANFFENVVERVTYAGLPGTEGTIQGPYYRVDAPMLTTTSSTRHRFEAA